MFTYVFRRQSSSVLGICLLLTAPAETFGQENQEIDLVGIQEADRQLEIAEQINLWGTVLEFFGLATTQRNVPVGQINEAVQKLGGTDTPEGAERAQSISRARSEVRQALEDVNTSYNRFLLGNSTSTSVLRREAQSASGVPTTSAPPPYIRIMPDGSVREYEQVVVIDFEGRERVMITDRYTVVDQAIRTDTTIKNGAIVDTQTYQLRSPPAISTEGADSSRTLGSRALTDEAQEALDKYIGRACEHADRRGQVASDGLLVRDLNADGMDDLILYHDKITCDGPNPKSNRCVRDNLCPVFILWPVISSYTGEPVFTGWRTYLGGDIEVGSETPPVLTYRSENGYFTIQWNGQLFKESQWRRHGD
ncbi:hypothetical protein [uncultured Tateyamaria sp.]|uniref:hypothetical protein n=1 Tax=uncultured Tateyamaria sp. TaxID=455651 RepID=UPI00261CDCDF|nr:hypothetical protein [uncultured Tateyamaria sp.]